MLYKMYEKKNKRFIIIIKNFLKFLNKIYQLFFLLNYLIVLTISFRSNFLRFLLNFL